MTSGFTLKEIALFWGVEREQWEGNCRHTSPDIDFLEQPKWLRKSAKVAVAGALAQAKEKAGGPFDTSFDLAAFSSFLNTERSDDNPGRFELSFLVADKSCLVEFPGMMFSGADQRELKATLRQIKNFDLASCVREVMALLDEDECWMLVTKLAKGILESSMNEHGANVLGESAIDCLRGIPVRKGRIIYP